MANMTFTAD